MLEEDRAERITFWTAWLVASQFAVINCTQHDN